MSIKNRKFKGGEVLVGTHKGKTTKVKVVKKEDGLRYVVGNKEYDSPRQAGAAICGFTGTFHLNPWKFFSLEGDEPVAKTPKTKTASPTGKTIKMMPKDPTRGWCSGCMAPIDLVDGKLPATCPAGHSNAKPTADAPTNGSTPAKRIPGTAKSKADQAKKKGAKSPAKKKVGAGA